jgi:menaquinone-dependent protoporphyrinogen IX oxidase
LKSWFLGGVVDKKVLVAYARKYGATAEIAEKIGQVLTQAGLEVDMLPVERVGELDLLAARGSDD